MKHLIHSIIFYFVIIVCTLFVKNKILSVFILSSNIFIYIVGFNYVKRTVTDVIVTKKDISKKELSDKVVQSLILYFNILLIIFAWKMILSN